MFLPNHPVLAPLRGEPSDVEEWVQVFAGGDPTRARRYREAIQVFLGTQEQPTSWGAPVGTQSPNTRRAYAYALQEFFEFLAHWRGRVVPPHEVTRKDVSDYVDWLENRGKHTILESQWNFSVRAEKLRDPEHRDLYAVWDAVRSLGGSARFEDIAGVLGKRFAPAEELDQLYQQLQQLLVLRVLHRTPTIEELRNRGAKVFSEPARETFVYSMPAIKPASQGTVHLRVQALASFWKVLQRGENVSADALLKYNVFEEATRRASRGLRREQKQRAQATRLTPEITRKLLRATEERDNLTDLRNAALLWFLILTGARVEEAVLVRRGRAQTDTERKQWPGWLDLESSPPSVVLQRKGETQQRIVMPRLVIELLKRFWTVLAEEAVDKRETNPRLKLLAEEPDAPLFPPIRFWGHNPYPGDSFGRLGYRKPMSTNNVRQLLRRLAQRAELTPAEMERVHPHAFRSAAAEAMVEGGKNLREVQHLLNHASITTTEGYLPDVADLERLVGEREVLEWLRRGAGPAEEPGVVQPRPVETTGELVEEKGLARHEGRVLEAEFEESELPSGPPLPPYPPPQLLLGLPSDGGIVAVGQADDSPAWPTHSYEQMALGDKPDVAWSGKPQSKWIQAFYDKLPVRFGVGKEDLLPWHNPQAPLPLPVLSPDQAYPELEQAGSLLEQLELLYDDWQATAPTSTLALAKWLQYFGSQTAGLERLTSNEYGWAPFQSAATKGVDLREHDTAWLVNWFRQNARTFNAAQRAFEQVTLPEPGESSETFWERVRTELSVVGGVPAVPTVPEYFADRDPVHAIYERDPQEFAAFARWLRRLTGGSDLRTQQREEQLSVQEERESAEREQARGLLELYFLYVDESVEFSDDDAPLEQMEAIANTLKVRYGIEAPKKGTPGEDRRARIDRVIDARYPRFAAPPTPLGNVLGDSRLFREDLLRIDDVRHTVVHEYSVKAEFAREHAGRNSECVMRRVARALWEHVREWEYEPARTGATKRKRASRSELRKQLFVVQLAVMSYIAPCAEDLEELTGTSAERPSEVAARLNEEIRKAAMGETRGETYGLSDVAMDIVETYYEQVPEADPLAQLEQAKAQERVAGFFAQAQSPEDQARQQEKERERKRASREKYRANARAVLPHPLRLVAATYWPV